MRSAGANTSVMDILPKELIGWASIFKDIILDISTDVSSAEVTGSYDRLEFIRDQIKSIGGDVNILNDGLSDSRNISIQTEIEENLAGNGGHPHPLAIFQLPEQYGGYLELAKNIVIETIGSKLAAGQSVYDAQIYLDRANLEFTMGEYKKVYLNYCKAYGEATLVIH